MLFLGGFSLVTLWVMFCIVYYLSRTEVKVVVEFVHLIAHVIVIWLWLFLPRLYIILVRPKKNTAQLPMSMKLARESGRRFSSGIIAMHSVIPSILPMSSPNLQPEPVSTDLELQSREYLK